MTITIDEAIKEIQDEIIEPHDPVVKRRMNAFRLGIEALKKWKDFREKSHNPSLYQLPGETE